MEFTIVTLFLIFVAISIGFYILAHKVRCGSGWECLSVIIFILSALCAMITATTSLVEHDESKTIVTITTPVEIQRLKSTGKIIVSYNDKEFISDKALIYNAPNEKIAIKRVAYKNRWGGNTGSQTSCIINEPTTKE